MLTGEEYAGMKFETLHARICDALRGNGPRVVAASRAPGGRMRILFENGNGLRKPPEGNPRPYIGSISIRYQETADSRFEIRRPRSSR